MNYESKEKKIGGCGGATFLPRQGQRSRSLPNYDQNDDDFKVNV